jgi:hypothetical protein
LVAPTLFSTLHDRVLAGTIAANLFRIEAWLSVFCSLIIAASLLPVHRDDIEKNRVMRTAAIMLACSVIGYFALHPWMTSLREAAGTDGVMASDFRRQFGLLHGLSSLLYLVQSLTGIKLLLMVR